MVGSDHSDSPPRRPAAAAREASESPPRRPPTSTSIPAVVSSKADKESPPRRPKTEESSRTRGDSRRREGRDSRDRRDADRHGDKRKYSRRERSRSRSRDRHRRRDDSRYRDDDRNRRRADRDSRDRPQHHKADEGRRRDADPRSSTQPPPQQSQQSRPVIDRPSRFQRKERAAEIPSDQIQWGREGQLTVEEAKALADAELAKQPQHKADFGLSGALAKDERTGNVVNNVVLKFTEPQDAALPEFRWRLYVYKGEEVVETLHIHRRSCFLFGRDVKVADIPLLNESCSGQHAVIQFREVQKLEEMEDGEEEVVRYVKPYLLDLKSTHGTKLNQKKIEDSRYYELREGDLIQFAASQREYVIMCDVAAGKIVRKKEEEEEQLER